MADTQDIERVLRHAAATAATAPSIFNTQPWRWQVGHKLLRLWADHDRRLLVADPNGRMLTISCGVSLHHARIALAAGRRAAAVCRLPDPDDPDLLATIDLDGPREPDPGEVKLYEAIPRRRTDRRVFGTDPVPKDVAEQLVSAAEAHGARLHLVHRDGTRLTSWLEAGAGPGALYAVIFTGADTPMDWLRAGEALSAVLLTATANGLETAPISDVTELSTTRETLRGLLPDCGVPQLAARVGHATAAPVPG